MKPIRYIAIALIIASALMAAGRSYSEDIDIVRFDPKAKRMPEKRVNKADAISFTNDLASVPGGLYQALVNADKGRLMGRMTAGLEQRAKSVFGAAGPADQFYSCMQAASLSNAIWTEAHAMVMASTQYGPAKLSSITAMSVSLGRFTQQCRSEVDALPR